MPFVIEPPESSPATLLRHVIKANDLTQEQVADACMVSRFTINQIINNRRAITANTALRLEKVLGVPSKTWLDLQHKVDLYRAYVQVKDELPSLIVLRSPTP